ncbi:MAG: hypothetical protein QXF04_01010 [Candidatus Aenigmatarchaeota archaeon]|nr:hypothetical protein [Candidatus Aenigmarchaeota archaeon]
MKVLILEKTKLEKVEEILKKNEKLSILSIYFRELKDIELKDKFALILDGPEEYIKIATELIREFTEIPNEELEEKIIKKFKEENLKASEGLGFLFS